MSSPAVKVTPPITVLMPVHNGERYVAAAIESILNQTYSDFELLIVDDASSDRTAEILAGYRDSRIRILRNEKQLRLIGTLNRGIQEARGRWIARMDADDLALRSRLRRQLHWLEAHPETAVLGGAAIKIDAEDRFRGLLFKRWLGDLRQWVWIPTPIVHPTAMIRRDVALEHPYSPEALHCEDYDLWIRLAKAGHRLHNLPWPLLRYRIHAQNVTAQNRELQLKTCFEVFRKHYPTAQVSFDEYVGLISPIKALGLKRRLELLSQIVGKAPSSLRLFQAYCWVRGYIQRPI